uniref:Uncharacterized protein n=1 Tax=Romanomermis culicivorax TaxID=13658 RepID=A0A915HMH5_ROMCU
MRVRINGPPIEEFDAERCSMNWTEEIYRMKRKIQHYFSLQQNLRKCTSSMPETDASSNLMESGISSSEVEQTISLNEDEDSISQGLANTIISKLQKMDIHLDYIVGQGYDGAAAMSGILSGVQTLIRNKFPKVLYVHCANHCLNLTLSKASKQVNLDLISALDQIDKSSLLL